MTKKKAVQAAQSEQPVKRVAYLIDGRGTDEEVRQRCADGIPSWQSLSKDQQDDIVRGMKAFAALPSPPTAKVSKIAEKLDIDPGTGDLTGYVINMVETFGSKSQHLIDARVSDLTHYHSRSNSRGITEQNFNASLAFVRGVKPQDPAQSALAVQMDATHDAAMRAISMIGGAQTTDHLQVYGNLANKLLNTYARQAEVLAKLQRGGEQVVKHVHVDNRGGQAVITDQIVTGGSGAKTGEQVYGTGTTAECAALLGTDPQGQPMSAPGPEGQEAVQVPRRNVHGRAG